MDAHEPDFASASEEQIMTTATRGFLNVVCLLAAEGEEAGALHAFLAHDDWYAHRSESMLLHHVIECVAKHCLVQAHTHAGQDVVAGAAHLYTALKVCQSKVAH
jgi:hypothetical protein